MVTKEPKYVVMPTCTPILNSVLWTSMVRSLLLARCSHTLTYLCACFNLLCMRSGNACISPSFLKDTAPPSAEVIARDDDAAPNYEVKDWVI